MGPRRGTKQTCTVCKKKGHRASTCAVAAGTAGTNQRRCWKCKKWKAPGEFLVKNKAKGEYQRTCRVCFRPYRRAWYKRHKHEQVGRVAKTRSVRKSELKRLTRELREKPCVDCKRTFPWFVMDFDHLSDKFKTVMRMVNNTYSRKRILAEVAKCEVVCANCHRIRTWNRQ